MTGPEPESPPAAADDDAILLRVLGALRTESSLHTIPAPRRASCDERLPRRIPGANPGSHSPWPTQEPLRVVRDASSIARTATGYMRGWRRGHEAALERRLSPATTAAAVARQPSSRRIAFRAGAAASRLVGLVVQVLPQGERRRYHEEFRAELSRLQGLHQLAYAIRLLLSALALRHALRQQRPGASGEE